MDYSTQQEPAHIVELRKWLSDSDGAFDSRARFIQAESGFCVTAAEDLPANTTIVSCPFRLVITQSLAQQSLLDLLALEDPPNLQWSERQWICSYLVLHWILGEESAPSQLAHFPYLKVLPSPDKLCTPLHFSQQELEAFKGTNLYGATIDRENTWKAEWTQCRDFFTNVREPWGLAFAWEFYLTAATYLSSRAFPSSLLSPTPSLKSSPSTGPVLIPGVDSLNHARGEPVSWMVTYPELAITTENASQEPRINLVIHKFTAQGQEIFNNYGPKPNSELILGYGFSIHQNPDDTVVLKIGGISGQKWEIGRHAAGAEGLWNEILNSVMEGTDEDPNYEDHLDASGMLAEMLQVLLDRLPDSDVEKQANIRPEIVSMREDYLEGQRDILCSLIAFAQEKEQLAIEMAKKEGIDLVLED